MANFKMAKAWIFNGREPIYLPFIKEKVFDTFDLLLSELERQIQLEDVKQKKIIKLNKKEERIDFLLLQSYSRKNIIDYQQKNSKVSSQIPQLIEKREGLIRGIEALQAYRKEKIGKNSEFMN